MRRGRRERRLGRGCGRVSLCGLGKVDWRYAYVAMATPAMAPLLKLLPPFEGEAAATLALLGTAVLLGSIIDVVTLGC